MKTGLFPLFEYANGIFQLSPMARRYKDPSKRVPVIDYLKLQGRFKHLLNKPEEIKKIEEYIDRVWYMIDVLEKAFNPREEARKLLKTL